MTRKLITDEITTSSGHIVKVVDKNILVKALRQVGLISVDDEEADRLAKEATRAAIIKARVCNKPIARFDLDKKKAYLEYADGHREYF